MDLTDLTAEAKAEAINQKKWKCQSFSLISYQLSPFFFLLDTQYLWHYRWLLIQKQDREKKLGKFHNWKNNFFFFHPNEYLIFERKIYELVSIINDTDRFRIEKNKMRFFLWRETLLWISRKRLPRWPVYTQNWAYLPSLQESGTRERDQTHIGEKRKLLS